MKNENFIMVTIVAIVAIVGIVSLMSNMNASSLSGEAYRGYSSSHVALNHKTTQGNPSAYSGRYSGASGKDSMSAGRDSGSSREGGSRSEGNTGFGIYPKKCVEAVNETVNGSNKYQIAGLSIVFQEGPNGAPRNIRRYADFCKKINGTKYLIEYSCAGKGSSEVVNEQIPCDCFKGFCPDYIIPTNNTGSANSSVTNTTIINCTDTDNGLIGTVYGVTTGTSHPNGLSDVCVEALPDGTPIMITTSCTASQFAPLNHTCGVLDHECVNNTVSEGVVVCNTCSSGVCTS